MENSNYMKTVFFVIGVGDQIEVPKVLPQIAKSVKILFFDQNIIKTHKCVFNRVVF